LDFRVQAVFLCYDIAMQEWWKKAFDERYLSFYRPILTEARTMQELAFVRRHLGLDPESKLLDVPCGYGRHSIELAKQGYLLSGIDQSQVMLQKAQQDAKSAGVEVDFQKGDMRQLPFVTAEFDGAIMLFTSFGYLGREGDRQVVAELGRVVRPGGRLILDQQNPWPSAEEAERRGRPLGNDRYETSSPLWQHEGIERMVWDARSRVMEVEEVWNDEQGTQRFNSRIAAYTVDEFRELLTGAGFKIEAVYGNFDSQPYRPGAERTVFVATR
jgi:SAM-dependent methyltransferase